MADVLKVTTSVVPEQKFRRVFFIDRNAELEDDDKEELERMGYLVVLVNGDPSRVVNAFIAQYYGD